uniref:Uncharacterized protein n=1 Tax=Anguilla anguilla TaxID=7936 RepID=A0A0E9UXL3_ANGAN
MTSGRDSSEASNCTKSGSDRQ